MHWQATQSMSKLTKTQKGQPTLKPESRSNANDKIIMNYHNQNFPAGFPFNHPQFPPWNQMPYQLPPIPSPHFPPYSHPPPLNLLVQQQNNYFNSNFSSQGQPLLESGNLSSMHPYAYPTNWMPRPDVPRQPVKEIASKKKPQVICLDDDSPIEAIVIEDSVEIIEMRESKTPKAPGGEMEIEPKKRGNEAGKHQLKQIVEKQIKQKGLSFFLHRSKKEGTIKQEPKVPQPAIFNSFPKSPKRLETKITKKKSIQHQRFVYRLRHHEKKLMELSDCRDYCVGEIMTGPQFQATLPPYRLFQKSQSWLARKKNHLLERLQH